MENATKALLIAGSILIAILLIAFGMKILIPATSTVDSSESAMKTTDMATFNSKFTAYIGTKNKAQVMSLLNVVIANNATSNHSVTITSGTGTVSPNSLMSNLENRTYTISITESDYEKGYVKNININ